MPPTATKHKDGNAIDYTPSSAVSAGDVVVLEDMIGIALDDIAADELGSLEIEGIFELPKDTSTALSAGDIVYWDEADNEVQDTADSGNNKQIGKVVQAQLSADATCLVKLIP